jgi:hypothetical protein
MALPPITLPGVTPMISPLWTPATAKQPTQIYEPLVVTTPGLVAGVILLAYRFDLDYTAGSFTGGPAVSGTTLNFPAGTILWKILASVTTVFNGVTPTISFGTSSGGTQLGTIALAPVGSVEEPTSPAILGPLPTNQVFISATLAATPSTGHASFAILFLGAPAAPWR